MTTCCNCEAVVYKAGLESVQGQHHNSLTLHHFDPTPSTTQIHHDTNTHPLQRRPLNWQPRRRHIRIPRLHRPRYPPQPQHHPSPKRRHTIRPESRARRQNRNPPRRPKRPRLNPKRPFPARRLDKRRRHRSDLLQRRKNPAHRSSAKCRHPRDRRRLQSIFSHTAPINPTLTPPPQLQVLTPHLISQHFLPLLQRTAHSPSLKPTLLVTSSHLPWDPIPQPLPLSLVKGAQRTGDFAEPGFWREWGALRVGFCAGGGGSGE